MFDLVVSHVVTLVLSVALLVYWRWAIVTFISLLCAVLSAVLVEKVGIRSNLSDWIPLLVVPLSAFWLSARGWKHHISVKKYLSIELLALGIGVLSGLGVYHTVFPDIERSTFFACFFMTIYSYASGMHLQSKHPSKEKTGASRIAY